MVFRLIRFHPLLGLYKDQQVTEQKRMKADEKRMHLK